MLLRERKRDRATAMKRRRRDALIVRKEILITTSNCCGHFSTHFALHSIKSICTNGRKIYSSPPPPAPPPTPPLPPMKEIAIWFFRLVKYGLFNSKAVPKLNADEHSNTHTHKQLHSLKMWFCQDFYAFDILVHVAAFSICFAPIFRLFCRIYILSHLNYDWTVSLNFLLISVKILLFKRKSLLHRALTFLWHCEKRMLTHRHTKRRERKKANMIRMFASSHSTKWN